MDDPTIIEGLVASDDKRPRNTSRILALVTDQEKAHHPFQGHKHCMALPQFMQHIGRVDHARSRLGVGGR